MTFYFFIDKLSFQIVPSKTQTYIAAKKPILAIINGEQDIKIY